MVYLLILLVMLPMTPAFAAPADQVVRVVSLDEEGNPQRQGMGVVLTEEGRILTSAALLSPYHRAIIITPNGTKYPVRQVSKWNFIQDLAIVEAGAEALSKAPIGDKNVEPDEIVWVAMRKNPPALKEVRVAKLLPFSPRMVLLKLDPGNLETDLGAPVFNGKGEFVGMLHGFTEKDGKPFQFFLARNRSHLPAEKPAQGAQNPVWTGELVEEQYIKACGTFWKGVADTLRQDWRGAQDHFSTSLRGFQSLHEAYYGRGVARYHLGEYEGAVQDFEHAIQGLPKYALAFLWLGKTWERRDRGDLALASYQKAVAADSKLSEAWFRLGAVNYRQGDLINAREHLEKSADDFPQAPDRWLLLGKIAQTQHETKKALEAFQQARKLDGNFSSAYFEEGKLLLDLGRPQEAIQLLAKVVENNPQWPQARYHLALAYAMSSNTAAAWEQYFLLQKIDLNMATQLSTFLEQMR